MQNDDCCRLRLSSDCMCSLLFPLKNSSIVSKRGKDLIWHLSIRPVVALSSPLQKLLDPLQDLSDMLYCINMYCIYSMNAVSLQLGCAGCCRCSWLSTWCAWSSGSPLPSGSGPGRHSTAGKSSSTGSEAAGSRPTSRPQIRSCK